ncbi:MAG: hypothetical protein SP4CHLAM5_03500 [Chlamydiia bacterium]|nr:hypothetical protein [Chlamydiia bacterium]MCH9618224.1 hypothetical protein [Chlamydiia bacterium]MCH9624053.1 hypothetical protein [Chlamydiia bacterium]
MRFFLLSIFLSLPLLSKVKEDIIFHKTIGKIEAYKEKETLNLRLGCVKRLTKNLLTPIHTRDLILNNKKEKHLLTQSSQGPLTVTFLLPITMKKMILELLATENLILSIPCKAGQNIKTARLEIDRYAVSPKGLFAMRSIIETDFLSPCEIIFIHLLKKTLNN